MSILSVLAVTLAACGSGSGSTAGSTGGDQPVQGGTLKLLGR